MKHLTEEDLVLLYYGEPEISPGIREHLAECPGCRKEFQSLRAVLQAVSSSPVPERPSNYEEALWRRLQPGLEEISHADSRSESVYGQVIDFDHGRGGWRRRLGAPGWMTAGAMAALLLLAFLAGQYLRINHSQPVLLTEQARERVLLFTVGEHLERSERVLTELANTDAGAPVDIAAEQRWAQDLLSSNRLYRLSSARAGETALAGVLEELERTLIEISHSSTHPSQSELEKLRSRIEEQGILFKIRILKSDIRQTQRLAARKASQQTS